MSRRSPSSVQLLSSSALALGLCVGWAWPSRALAAPPEQPAAAPVPAPVYQPPAPEPTPPAPHNRNRGLGLVIAGSTVFGVGYLVAVITSVGMIGENVEEVRRPLPIPLAGPFIAVSRSQHGFVNFGLVMAGAIQIAGLGMGIGGGVILGKSRRQARLSIAPGGVQLRF